MKNYIYQNNLIGKKQLRQLLAWSFTNYDSIQACAVADELKYLGFKYATQAGISISIEDLKIPFIKNLMLAKANQEISNSEKIYLKGKITDVERFQKIIDTWSITSESLKEEVIYYFKNYDPLNSVYIMAFSGARGNLSQVRQLVGMRGLMSDPNGEIMKLPIKKNFREGLTITDYLMSGYGARKGIVDTALKTANSGYLTRRLIDVGQDILIREKDCLTSHSFLISTKINFLKNDTIFEKILGRIVNKAIFDPLTNKLIASANSQITRKLANECKKKKVQNFYIRSPLTCNLYRAICQNCYGWDLANENLVDIGEAIGILAGQSIGEPGTQLTMRTFHTGGIFTSKTRQQIISPENGIIRFSKILNTILLRTNRGEDVLITQNSGFILLIPSDKKKSLIQIEILKSTILFPKNNQYVLKDMVIGELINTNNQIKSEIQPIVSDTSGEIFVPRLKKKANVINNNKLVWILSGKFYNSPRNSFINFYSDYKLNSYSYIFRTKIINHYTGNTIFINSNKNLFQRFLCLTNKKYLLTSSIFFPLKKSVKNKNSVLVIENDKFLINLQIKNLRFYLQQTHNQQIGYLINQDFKTLTGGTLYYDTRNIQNSNPKNQSITYLNRTNLNSKYNSLNLFKTITWLSEEIHKVNCEPNILLVEHNDFISKGFELIPGLFSKTAGIVNINQKNNLIQTISIKSGLVYEIKKFKKIIKQLYYPGEIIFYNVSVQSLTFCQQIKGKQTDKLLLRPVIIFESSHQPLNIISNKNKENNNSTLKLVSKSIYSYKSNQKIKGTKNLNLISKILIFNFKKWLNKNIHIQLLKNFNLNQLILLCNEKIYLNNYILPNLKYKDIESCFLLQKNQFIDNYTILGYLETKILNSLEIVKFKIKDKENKQIFLISNDDCLILEKKYFLNFQLNNFIINSSNVYEIGKIIIKNNKFLTLQKGRPYFFPNCKNETFINKTRLQYKTISFKRIFSNFKTNRQISLNYYNLIKVSVRHSRNFKDLIPKRFMVKTEFSKLILKRNGKLYSSLIPQFFKKFSINNSVLNFNSKQIIQPTSDLPSNERKLERTLLLQSLDTIKNKYKETHRNNFNLTLVKLMEQPFLKSTKSIGLYAITEDYFEQDVNSVFCKNSEFIETGETIGLLNLEKEITGDIVQGLPRIEEILEARKKNLTLQRVPTSQKKGLLVQKTSLDPNFEFCKLGTTIKENEKINPHKLLKVYFNYYGLIKSFICERTKKVKFTRLIQNYEGSYKSFKKVQSFILESVQSVYQSQSVSINDKHLEVIVKQMTTKVLITYEGNTPLLRKEVIDLYHIQYINQIIKIQGRQSACYVPLLLGITKAALNNPSFISAASFQETTRVLTRSAIEGRIDWLRGLKENIIIGHLIPAGTGSQNFKNCFKGKKLIKSNFYY